jgi:hypothetical protein
MAKRPVPVVHPWHPAPWNAVDAYALKALATGTANPGQQKRALDWIINAAGTFDLEWRPDDRATSFASGKRYLGLQIVKLVNMPAELIQGPIHDE